MTRLLVAATAASAASAAFATPPHIIHIMADDLGRDNLGLSNGGLTFTPAIDTLAAEGLILDSFYTFKICAPSRASTMVGRYPFNAGAPRVPLSTPATRCVPCHKTDPEKVVVWFDVKGAH